MFLAWGGCYNFWYIVVRGECVNGLDLEYMRVKFMYFFDFFFLGLKLRELNFILKRIFKVENIG